MWYQSEIPLLSLPLCNWDDAKRWIYQGNLHSCKSFSEPLSQTERGRNRGWQSRPNYVSLYQMQEVQEKNESRFQPLTFAWFLGTMLWLARGSIRSQREKYRMWSRHPLLKSLLICVPKVQSLMSARAQTYWFNMTAFKNGVIGLWVGKNGSVWLHARLDNNKKCLYLPVTWHVFQGQMLICISKGNVFPRESNFLM